MAVEKKGMATSLITSDFMKRQSWHHLFPCFVHKESAYIGIDVCRCSNNYFNMYIEIIVDVHTRADKFSLSQRAGAVI